MNTLRLASIGIVALGLWTATVYGNPRHGMGPMGLGHMMGEGPGMMLPMVLKGLDLTDAQRDQIRSILEARRAANEPLMERARTAREALQQAMQAQPVDEATIRARSADLGAVEADLAIARAQVQAEITAVLTDEQKAELAKMREERNERMENRREWMRGRRGR